MTISIQEKRHARLPLVGLLIVALVMPTSGLAQIQVDPESQQRIAKLNREIQRLKVQLRNLERQVQACENKKARLGQDAVASQRALNEQTSQIRRFTSTEQGVEAQREFQVLSLKNRLRNLKGPSALNVLDAGIPAVKGGITCDEMVVLVREIGSVSGLRDVLVANTKSLIYPVEGWCLAELEIELGPRAGPAVAEAVRKAGPVIIMEPGP